MTRRQVYELVLLGLALLAVAFLLRPYLTLDELVRRERQLTEWQRQQPLGFYLISFAIYTLASLIPGTAGKSVLAGWLFAPLPAVVLVNGSLTIAALLSFGASRYYFRDSIQSRFGYHLWQLDQRLAGRGSSWPLMLRLLHAPYTLTNYLLGASSLPWTTFWWSTQLGLLPANVVWVFVGGRLPSLRTLQEEGVESLLDVRTIAVLVILSSVPLVLQAIIRRVVVGNSSGDPPK